jgi:hypothetical protein
VFQTSTAVERRLRLQCARSKAPVRRDFTRHYLTPVSE